MQVLAAPHRAVEGVGVVAVVIGLGDLADVGLAVGARRAAPADQVQGGFLGHVDEEVRLVLGIGVLEVAIGAHALEAGLLEQAAHVVLADRAQVERETGAVLEGVFEAHQRIVDMLGLGRHLVAAVVVLVLAAEALVEDRVVVALVDDQDAVVLERGVELGQRAAPVGLVVQMGEGIAEADDGVVLALDVAVEPAPVGLHRLEDQPALLAVVEGLGEHRRGAVGGRHVEAGLGQADGMEPGAAGDVEHRLLAAGAQHVDEELSLALGARRPVDQLVPLVDERCDILALVEVGLAVGQRVVAVLLRLQHQFGVALLLAVESLHGVALLLLAVQFGVAPVQGCFGHGASVRQVYDAHAAGTRPSCEWACTIGSESRPQVLLCLAPHGHRARQVPANETAGAALTRTAGSPAIAARAVRLRGRPDGTRLRLRSDTAANS
jgi:hypothetical protein